MIHGDFLQLLDVEIAVFGRNREHLIQLPDALRNEVRKFVADVALKKAKVAESLDAFYREDQMKKNLQLQGNGAQAQLHMNASMEYLAAAHAAADKLRAGV